MPCFAYPARDEIEIDGRKIIGSAQKRTGGWFLQHGSVPLQGDDGLLQRISLVDDENTSWERTSLSEALRREVDRDWAVKRLVKGMAEHFDIHFKPLILGEEAEEEIRRLQAIRYESDSWTRGSPFGH